MHCNTSVFQIFINNYQQSKKRKAADVHPVPAAEPKPTHDPQLAEAPSIPAHLQELNNILVQRLCKVRLVPSEKMPAYQLFQRLCKVHLVPSEKMPGYQLFQRLCKVRLVPSEKMPGYQLFQRLCKVRLVPSENMPGYQLFLRKLGAELTDVNKDLKRENSQAELVPINECQMAPSKSGAPRVISQTLANKENVESTGGSIEELHEVQRKAYLTMVGVIRNFVKLGGTHIATSRLLYGSEDNRHIVSVASGELSDETTRQTAKGIIIARRLMQKVGPKSNIIALPKVVSRGVQICCRAFQADLLRKFQKFKPDVKRIPLMELRKGKTQGVRMINWPSSVVKFRNFNKNELDEIQCPL
ncbi:hypothetical protein BJ741DRAFT_584487 [Chytriomyces cf. hyalinus JEL632]|nr:hypothetical protein BJ741DRAFT_584487 [Chytriomyces cf. hyalinus JEL632]